MYVPNNFYFYLMWALIVLCLLLLVAIVLMVIQFVKYKKKLKKFLTLNSYAKDFQKAESETLGKVSGYFGRRENDLSEDLLFENQKFYE